MADRPVIIYPETLKLPVTNPLRIEGGENDFFDLFDDTISQSGRKKFRLPTDFVGNPRLVLQFSPADLQVGTLTVKWSISVMANVMDSGVNWKSDSFDTVNTGTKTMALNHGSGHPTEITIPLTNFDSGSGGNSITIKIALDVTGTVSGDVELGTITFLYSDT
jgi:hypothetical protein